MKQNISPIILLLADFVKYSQRGPMIIGWVALIAFSAMYIVVSLLSLAGAPLTPSYFENSEFSEIQNIEITGDVILSTFAYVSLLFYFLGAILKKLGWKRRILPENFKGKIGVSFLSLVGIFITVSLFHIAMPGDNGTDAFWIWGIGSLLILFLTFYSLIVDLIVDTIINRLTETRPVN